MYWGVFIYQNKSTGEQFCSRVVLYWDTGKRFTSLSGLSEDTYTYFFYRQPVYKQLVLE